MLDAIFAPRAVAVIGASPDPARLGHRVLRNIIDHGYAGRILPIHPQATTILGLPSYPKVSAAPGPIDLAVVVVPARAVLDVVEDCGRAGVAGLVVISAGSRRSAGQAGRSSSSYSSGCGTMACA